MNVDGVKLVMPLGKNRHFGIMLFYCIRGLFDAACLFLLKYYSNDDFWKNIIFYSEFENELDGFNQLRPWREQASITQEMRFPDFYEKYLDCRTWHRMAGSLLLVDRILCPWFSACVSNKLFALDDGGLLLRAVH